MGFVRDCCRQLSCSSDEYYIPTLLSLSGMEQQTTCHSSVVQACLPFCTGIAAEMIWVLRTLRFTPLLIAGCPASCLLRYLN